MTYLILNVKVGLYIVYPTMLEQTIVATKAGQLDHRVSTLLRTYVSIIREDVLFCAWRVANAE